MGTASSELPRCLSPLDPIEQGIVPGPGGKMRFLLDGASLWAQAEDIHFVTHLPDLEAPPDVDSEIEIEYTENQLFVFAPPGRPWLYILRQILHCTEMYWKRESDRVISEQEAADMCHSAGVNPGGRLGRLIERADLDRLEAVYAGYQDKQVAVPADCRLPGELSRRTFTYRGATVEWGRANARYELVKALWDVSRHRPATPRTKDEVSAAVYPRVKRTKGRLKNLVQKVRKVFEEAKMPLVLRDEAGMLSLEDLAD